MEYLKSIFDLTKLPTKFFVLFAVVTGYILFGDAELLSKLNLTDIKKSEGSKVGITFIFSAGLVIVNSCIWVFNYFSRKIRISNIRKDFKKTLRKLDLKEKAVIREFHIQTQSSIDMPYDDPVIAGLMSKNILIINKQFGNSFIATGSKTAMSLNPYAEEILTFEMIGLKNKLNKREQDLIINNRPKWTRSFPW